MQKVFTGVRIRTLGLINRAHLYWARVGISYCAVRGGPGLESKMRPNPHSIAHLHTTKVVNSQYPKCWASEDQIWNVE